MDIKSLEKLKKIDNTLYDLYSSVEINGTNLNIFLFQLSDKHSMRMDLVCYDIYRNTDYIDILTVLNGITNVFAINSGDIIYFLDETDIEKAKSSNTITAQIIDSIKGANTGKSHKQDNNRTKDINTRRQTEKDKQYIPYNILQATSNFEQNNGVITIKPNF